MVIIGVIYLNLSYEWPKIFRNKKSDNSRTHPAPPGQVMVEQQSPRSGFELEALSREVPQPPIASRLSTICGNAIRNQTLAFQIIKEHEDKNAFSPRVNTAALKSENVHDEDEKMTAFVDGLDTSIRTVVARFRDNEARYEMTYGRLVQFAKDEGNSYRARLGIRAKTPTGPEKTRARNTREIPLRTPMVAFADQLAIEKGLNLNEEGSCEPLFPPKPRNYRQPYRMKKPKAQRRARSALIFTDKSAKKP